MVLEVCDVSSQRWMPIETMKKSFFEDEIYSNGYFLMFSVKNGAQRVYHGYEDVHGIDVWLFADGLEMKDPTHWIFLPKPPRGL